MVTASEAAELLSLSRPTVYRMIRSGALPARRVGLGPRAAVRVPLAELEEHLHRYPTQEDPSP